MEKIKKLGVQLYTVRDFMQTEEDVRETFRKLKALGYDQAQTAGCAIPYEVFGQLAKEEGIEIVGTHDNFQLMCDDFDAALKNHQALNTMYMGVGILNKHTAAEYEEFVKKANIVGEKLAPYGGRFTYHNHSHEFAALDDGRKGWNILVEGLNPETTSFVLDTYWIANAGGDVINWINKLSGRVDILHLKDKSVTPKSQNTYICEIGVGNLNWDGIIEAAHKAGVKYFVVEQDTCPGDPFDSLKISAEFIRKNFM